MRQASIIFILLFLFQLDLTAQNQGQLLQTDKLKEDFRIFKGSLQEGHPGLYWYKTPEQMNDIFDQTEKKLNETLSQVEFFNLLYTIVDSINCGHSAILFSKPLVCKIDSVNKYFPFCISIVNNKLLLQKSLSDVIITEGTEIKSINGVTSNEILKKLYAYCTTDKGLLNKKKRTVEIMFSYYYALFIDTPETFKMVLVNKSSLKKEEIEVKAIGWNKDNFYKSIREYVASKKPIEFSAINVNTALLSIHTFGPGNYKKNNIDFNDTLNKIFRIIAKQKYNKLVIDLRDNNGGSLSYGSLLYSFLTESKFKYFKDNIIKVKTAEGTFTYAKYCDEAPKQESLEGFTKQNNNTYLIDRSDSTFAESNNFKGTVYILTNGLTFSSASLFTSFCKANRFRTIIIGETPGGAYEGCNGGGPISITLPNSKLVLFFNLVSLNLNVPPQKDNHSIAIDYFLSDTFDNKLIYDYINKH